jgi:hypothetical protein
MSSPEFNARKNKQKFGKLAWGGVTGNRKWPHIDEPPKNGRLTFQEVISKFANCKICDVFEQQEDSDDRPVPLPRPELDKDEFEWSSATKPSIFKLMDELEAERARAKTASDLSPKSSSSMSPKRDRAASAQTPLRSAKPWEENATASPTWLSDQQTRQRLFEEGETPQSPSRRPTDSRDSSPTRSPTKLTSDRGDPESDSLTPTNKNVTLPKCFQFVDKVLSSMFQREMLASFALGNIWMLSDDSGIDSSSILSWTRRQVFLREKPNELAMTWSLYTDEGEVEVVCILTCESGRARVQERRPIDLQPMNTETFEWYLEQLEPSEEKSRPIEKLFPFSVTTNNTESQVRKFIVGTPQRATTNSLMSFLRTKLEDLPAPDKSGGSAAASVQTAV